MFIIHINHIHLYTVVYIHIKHGDDNMSDETKMLLSVPANLKKEFQIACLENDTNMSDAIRSLMRAYVLKNRRNKK